MKAEATEKILPRVEVKPKPEPKETPIHTGKDLLQFVTRQTPKERRAKQTLLEWNKKENSLTLSNFGKTVAREVYLQLKATHHNPDYQTLMTRVGELRDDVRALLKVLEKKPGVPLVRGVEPLLAKRETVITKEEWAKMTEEEKRLLINENLEYALQLMLDEAQVRALVEHLKSSVFKKVPSGYLEKGILTEEGRRVSRALFEELVALSKKETVREDAMDLENLLLSKIDQLKRASEISGELRLFLKKAIQSAERRWQYGELKETFAGLQGENAPSAWAEIIKEIQAGEKEKGRRETPFALRAWQLAPLVWKARAQLCHEVEAVLYARYLKDPQKSTFLPSEIKKAVLIAENKFSVSVKEDESLPQLVGQFYGIGKGEEASLRRKKMVDTVIETLDRLEAREIKKIEAEKIEQAAELSSSFVGGRLLLRLTQGFEKLGQLYEKIASSKKALWALDFLRVAPELLTWGTVIGSAAQAPAHEAFKIITEGIDGLEEAASKIREDPSLRNVVGNIAEEIGELVSGIKETALKNTPHLRKGLDLSPSIVYAAEATDDEVEEGFQLPKVASKHALRGEKIKVEEEKAPAPPEEEPPLVDVEEIKKEMRDLKAAERKARKKPVSEPEPEASPPPPGEEAPKFGFEIQNVSEVPLYWRKAFEGDNMNVLVEKAGGKIHIYPQEGKNECVASSLASALALVDPEHPPSSLDEVSQVADKILKLPEYHEEKPEESQVLKVNGKEIIKLGPSSSETLRFLSKVNDQLYYFNKGYGEPLSPETLAEARQKFSEFISGLDEQGKVALIGWNGVFIKADGTRLDVGHYGIAVNTFGESLIVTDGNLGWTATGLQNFKEMGAESAGTMLMRVPLNENFFRDLRIEIYIVSKPGR